MNITFNNETDGKVMAGSLPIGTVFTPDMKTFYLVISSYNLDGFFKRECGRHFPTLNLSDNSISCYVWDYPVYVCNSELKLSLKNS